MWNESGTFRPKFNQKIPNGPRFEMRWKLFRFVSFFELVWNVSAIPDETERNWQPSDAQLLRVSRPSLWTLLVLITFLYFLFNHMIKTYAYKIKHQPKNRHLFKTIISRKQIKINNAVHFSTNLILNNKIKKK
jgi:hypothetical protein